ncbi:unnamed protein product [Effrenium voratum]|uniref:Uncharacterized protein n=1 Tax=Effrenium voratum TaxID=2562239 RepID=A0AA36IR93_9DINO|nr:unnamed protein product [Effrenium voratum]
MPPRPVKREDELDKLLRDLPAMGAWIWSQPWLIDDDTKVAKRVAWLNKFGHLAQPIDWPEVADLLDSLKVPQAMVLLQELEMQGNKVADPTDFIKRAVAVAQVGGDEIEPAGSAVTARIAELNESGTLAAPIDITVGEDLARLPESDALELLQEVASRGAGVKNPTGAIRFKLKARLAVLDDSKILKRSRPAVASAFASKKAKVQQEKPVTPLQAVQQANRAGSIFEAKKEEEEEQELPEPEQEHEHQEAVDEWWAEEEVVTEDYSEKAEEMDALDQDWFDWAAADEPVKKPRTSAAELGLQALPLPRKKEARAAPRVVGGLTGYRQLVPARATAQRSYEGVKQEPESSVQKPAPVSGASSRLPITPQEKMSQVRNYAWKRKLQLNEESLKGLARLPFYRAKDLIEEVILGGRKRQGVNNPSRYIINAVQKLSVGLVPQGIAMELAVSLGVVLNNDALDELASIPRQESHGIIRELARNPALRGDPMQYIQQEVSKCRDQMDDGTDARAGKHE